MLRIATTLLLAVADPPPAANLAKPTAAATRPATSTVTLPALPIAVSSFGAVRAGDHLYVFGGHSGKAHTYSKTTALGRFLRLKADGGKAWEELPPGPPAQGLTLVEHRGAVLRLGGMHSKNETGAKADSWSMDTAARFDPATMKWTSLPALPTPLSSFDAVCIGDTLYVVGGWNMKGLDQDSEWALDTLALDLADPAAKWRSLGAPLGRRAITAVAHQGKVWAFGGMDEDGDISKKAAVFDPTTKKWSDGPALPVGKMAGFTPASLVADGRVCLSPPDGNLYRLRPDGKEWDTIGTLQHPRLVHRLVAGAHGSMVVLGGASKTGNVTVVETIVPNAAPAKTIVTR